MRKKDQSQSCEESSSYCFAQSTSWDVENPSVYRYCISEFDLENNFNITVNSRKKKIQKCKIMFGDVEECITVCARGNFS